MSATSLIGQVLNDRYQIDRLIGEGGMGAVYEAHHVLLPRRVAIKALRQVLARGPRHLAYRAPEHRP